jgi:hypothetical protein
MINLRLSLQTGRLSAAAHGLSGIASDGAAVGLGLLASARQAFRMADAAVAANFFHALDVAENFTAKSAFDRVFFFDNITQNICCFFRQIFDAQFLDMICLALFMPMP